MTISPNNSPWSIYNLNWDPKGCLQVLNTTTQQTCYISNNVVPIAENNIIATIYLCNQENLRCTGTHQTSSTSFDLHTLTEFLWQDLAFTFFLQIAISPFSYFFSQQRSSASFSIRLCSAWRSFLDRCHVL